MVGQIVMYGGISEPSGWHFCNGQMLDPGSFPGLFAVIGTRFGGNGITSFGMPDFRARFPTHPGGGVGFDPTFAQMGGQQSVTLSYSNLPSHSHTLKCTNSDGTSSHPAGNIIAGMAPSSGTVAAYSGATPDADMAVLSIGDAGGSTPVEVVPPFTGVNFIISDS